MNDAVFRDIQPPFVRRCRSFSTDVFWDIGPVRGIKLNGDHLICKANASRSEDSL